MPIAPDDPSPAPTAALLLRVSGPDHPGITADLMTLLDLAEVEDALCH